MGGVFWGKPKYSRELIDKHPGELQSSGKLARSGEQLIFIHFGEIKHAEELMRSGKLTPWGERANLGMPQLSVMSGYP